MGDLVRLKYATTQEFSVGGISYSYTYIRVKVKNVAFDKAVGVRYRQGSEWLDFPLPWLENCGDYDLFGVNQGFVTTELAVWATEAGQTDWDNYGGVNYQVQNFHNVAGGDVVLSQATAKRGVEAGGGFTFDTSWFEGDIYVNNLAFQKRVGVRFTTDGGAIWQDCDAVWSGGASEGTYALTSGAERFHFKTPEYNYDALSPDFRFAVYYQRQDNGAWHWDNNFGQDYTLSKTDGATIL